LAYTVRQCGLRSPAVIVDCDGERYKPDLQQDRSVTDRTVQEIAPMKKLSLVRSLLLFTMLTSGVGVMLFCAGFLVFDLHTFREKKVNDLKSTADLLSANANSALGFADSETGSRVVEAMRVRSGIRTAILEGRPVGTI
jgi:hypothetical protein